MTRRARIVAIGAVLAATAGGRAQERAAEIGPRLLQDAAVRAAVEAAKADEAQTLEDQAALCEVPAPPFEEQKRAAVYKQRFEQLGLRNVRIDRVGNVLGERPGLGPSPHLVFSAHLDTVFPAGTDVTVKREGSIMRGPGIGDDCRGLAVVLGVIRALDKANVQTPGTITFVGTVGEEGLGDLRGVKELFGGELEGKIDRFVSVDGTGLGITHIAVGSHRYRVTYKGPGGHSYGAFGLVNPVHALGRAIGKIADFQVPRDPKTTFNVGRIGGGTSVNSIAFEAWMEVDMRSADAASLTSLDASFHKAVDTALAEENERWGSGRTLTVTKDLVGDRPAGRTPAESPVVRAAVSVTEALGLPVMLDEGSTDSNVPMSLGIPAVTIDGGGRGTGAHSLGEAFDATDSWKGTQRATLLAIALSRR
jgi:acetylornithine deacetylase/succinyl-diaminopimelate desuccinylase-like protein